MIDTWQIILVHQIIFQGMFVTKNIILKKKTGKRIRGKNKEANMSIAIFVVFIATALVFSSFNNPIGEIRLFDKKLAEILGLVFLFFNLIISSASLLHLKDSWRVGVIDDQKTDLVISGIYRFTRNPYFLSYFLMFAAYIILLQNMVLLVIAILGVMLVHKMVLKEEKYLLSVHGQDYMDYKKKVPRYILI